MSASLISQLNNSQILADVSDGLEISLSNHPILNLFGWDSEAQIGEGGRKFTWMEETREEPYGKLGSNYTTGTTLASNPSFTAKVKAGDVIHLDGHLDTNGLKIKAQVSSISGDNLTVAWLEGAANTAYTIGTTGTGVIHITRSKPDGAVKDTGGVDEPSPVYQYNQLFQRTVDVGNKALQLSQFTDRIWGFNEDDILLRGIAQRMNEMVHEIDNAFWLGYGIAETGTTDLLAAKMRGIDSFVNQTTGVRKNFGGNPLDEWGVNDMITQMYANGLPVGSTILFVGHPDACRTLASFRKNNTQYINFGLNSEMGGSVQIMWAQVGDYAIRLVPNVKLNVKSSYLIAQDYVKFSAPPIVAPSGTRVIGVPGGLTQMKAWLVDATVPGTHGVSVVLRSELAIKVIKALKYHAYMYNYTTGDISS